MITINTIAGAIVIGNMITIAIISIVGVACFYGLSVYKRKRGMK